MKKSTLIPLAIASILCSGCGGLTGFLLYDTDPTLTPPQEIEAFAQSNQVAFEWKKIEDSRVVGINIYRGTPQERFRSDQGFKRIGSIPNRYGTHFVDSKLTPEHAYLYTFTTFSLTRESKPSSIVRIKTTPAVAGVSFIEAYREGAAVVKLLWRPHTDGAVAGYIVQRKQGTGAWKYLGQVEGRLMVEYIDRGVKPSYHYSYRVIAKRYDGTTTQPSPQTDILL